MSIAQAVLTALFVVIVVFAVLVAIIFAIKLLSLIIRSIEKLKNQSTQNQNEQ